MRRTGSRTIWLSLLVLPGTSACSLPLTDANAEQTSAEAGGDAQGDAGDADQLLSMASAPPAAASPRTPARRRARTAPGVAAPRGEGGAPARSGAMFSGIGDLPGGDFASAALDVNADGSVVVGRGAAPDGQRAIRWTPAGGIASLGGAASEARAVNAAGDVVAGSMADSGGRRRAARWVDGAGPTLLAFPSSLLIASSAAYGLSGDGALVVGSAEQSAAGPVGVSWADGALAHFGAPYSIITAASADGSVIVGYRSMQRYPTDQSAYYNGERLPFPEDATCQDQACRCVSPQDCTGQALDVSADGTVVVGSYARLSGGTSALRWRVHAGTGVETIVLARDAEALGISHDGKVAVGYQRVGDAKVATLWGEDGVGHRIADLLTEAGLDVGGWVLAQARAASADGRVIVGEGTDPSGAAEGWVAVLP